MKKDNSQPLALLNTSIITKPGTYQMKPISLDTAKQRVQGALAMQQMHETDARANGYSTESTGILSAVGHEATANILTELLGVPVAVNRINFQQQDDQFAIVFKLKGRPQEGRILNREEIEEVGYEFYLLEKRDSCFVTP